MKHLDDVDIVIATFLDQNGRASNREISRHLGIAQTTVRDRLGHMFESGKLKITAVFDTETFVVLSNIGLYVPATAMSYLMGCNEEADKSNTQKQEVLPGKAE